VPTRNPLHCSMLSLEELFCHVDDFCQMFEPLWNTHLLKSGVRTRNRLSGLGLSERMTILVAFHQMGYRTFKDFYQKLVQPYWKPYFPGLVSYSRASTITPFIPVPFVCLPEILLWLSYWYQFYRFD